MWQLLRPTSAIQPIEIAGSSSSNKWQLLVVNKYVPSWPRFQSHDELMFSLSPLLLQNLSCMQAGQYNKGSFSTLCCYCFPGVHWLHVLMTLHIDAGHSLWSSEWLSNSVDTSKTMRLSKTFCNLSLPIKEEITCAVGAISLALLRILALETAQNSEFQTYICLHVIVQLPRFPLRWKDINQTLPVWLWRVGQVILAHPSNKLQSISNF